MVIKEHQLEKIIEDSTQFLNILIYGPNEGLVKDQIEKLVKNYLSQGEYEEISFNGRAIDRCLGTNAKRYQNFLTKHYVELGARINVDFAIPQ